MDSFEWFGGIGSQQFDSLKPSGDIYRETFDTARMGMESRGGGGGGGGGSQKDRDETFEGVKEQWRYKNEQGRRNYWWTKEGVDIKRRNEETLLQHKEYTNKINYLQGVRANRYFNDARRDAWEIGKVFQEKQFELNAKAAKLAGRAADLWRYEKELELELEKQATNLEQEMSWLKKNDGQAAAAFKDQNALVNYLKESGKAKLGTQGRSQERNINDVISAYGRMQSQLNYEVNSLDSKFNLEQMGFKYKKWGQYQTGLSILANWNVKMDQIALQWEGQDLKTRASVSPFAPVKQLDPIAPIALPRSEWQYPLNWEDIPEPRSGMSFDGGTSGGQGGGAGGWGGAIGTLGSAMVGAAALPGFTAAGAGAVSGAATLGAASGFGFLGPVGFGLMAGAAIGSAAGWW